MNPSDQLLAEYRDERGAPLENRLKRLFLHVLEVRQGIRPVINEFHQYHKSLHGPYIRTRSLVVTDSTAYILEASFRAEDHAIHTVGVTIELPRGRPDIVVRIAGTGRGKPLLAITIGDMDYPYATCHPDDLWSPDKFRDALVATVRGRGAAGPRRAGDEILNVDSGLIGTVLEFLTLMAGLLVDEIEGLPPADKKKIMKIIGREADGNWDDWRDTLALYVKAKDSLDSHPAEFRNLGTQALLGLASNQIAWDLLFAKHFSERGTVLSAIETSDLLLGTVSRFAGPVPSDLEDAVNLRLRAVLAILRAKDSSIQRVADMIQAA